MAGALELKHVQKGKGRVHLTPAIRQGEPVRTLCGRELEAGSVRDVDAPPDCGLCVRRSRDPAAVSGAFFAGDEGERVLELAIEAARSRRPPSPPSEPRRPATPAARARGAPPPPAPPEPRSPGELDRRGLREFSDNVYLAPGGLIVRVEGERVTEVVGEGGFQLLRRGDRLTLRAGGLRVEARVQGLEARLEDGAS
jgi:hypothetical protein